MPRMLPNDRFSRLKHLFAYALVSLFATHAFCAETPQFDELPDFVRNDKVFDWVRLTSGEWLKGEIEDLQDDMFVFDSDILDTLKLDWEDVDIVYSPRTNTLLFDNNTTTQGRVLFDARNVKVTSAKGEETTYARRQVRSMISGERKESNLWSSKLTLGAVLRSGNTDQTDLTALLKINRRDVFSLWTFEYNGAFGTTDDQKTTNNHRALANFDRYLTERLYLTPFRIVYFRDEFQNLAYRITPSAGLGYDLVDDDELDWRVAGGAGWEFTEYLDPPPGLSNREDSFAVLGHTDLAWEVNDHVDAGFELDITVPIRNADSFNLRAVAYTEVELMDDLDLDVRLVWDRQNNPVPDSSGVVPEKDDFRFELGLGFDF